MIVIFIKSENNQNNQNEIDKIKMSKELCRKCVVPEFVVTDIDNRIRELKIKRRSIFGFVPAEIDTIDYLSHEHLRISNE